MYDANKIIPGVIIFFALLTSPIWFTAASGKIDYKPVLKIVTEEKQCIEPTQWMIANHGDLLISWREEVVRIGHRNWAASDGKEYEMNLTDTCLKCHSNKQDFCDECHNYVGVRLFCWNCHNVPEEGGESTNANQ